MAALNMQQLRAYVTGGGDRVLPTGYIRLDITHNLLASRFKEIEFTLTQSISSIKEKIHSMTGSNEKYMTLLLNGTYEMREEDNKCLGEYPGAVDHAFIHVIDSDPSSIARGRALDDVTLVKKFELSEEEYEKRENTYRAYKKKMLAADPNWKSIYEQQSEARVNERRAARAAAGYPREVYETLAQVSQRIRVGDRCIVTPGARRGEVKYVGHVKELPEYERIIGGDETKTNETTTDSTATKDEESKVPELESISPVSSSAVASNAAAASAAAPPSSTNADVPSTDANGAPLEPCIWIGVAFDEPVGKHNGTVRGVKYFDAGHHCGAFVKPSAVKTGDYPVVDPFDEDEDENAAETSSAQAGGTSNADMYEEL